MFSALPQTVQDEIVNLAERYGSPVARSLELADTGNFEPMNKRDRYGEVCMVVRRPNGRLLTMIKTHYPKGAYRLLTGGINHGESILDALLRETQEETGLQVQIQRFLAAAAYHHPLQNHGFYTFAFLLDETGGTLGAIDESEQVEDFHEITIEELPLLAENLKRLGAETNDLTWKEWGIFRSFIHELVYESLTQSPQ